MRYVRIVFLALSAIRSWVRSRKFADQVQIPKEPVKVLRGLLHHVRKTSIVLQHEAAEIRVEKAKGK